MKNKLAPHAPTLILGKSTASVHVMNVMSHLGNKEVWMYGDSLTSDKTINKGFLHLQESRNVIKQVIGMQSKLTQKMSNEVEEYCRQNGIDFYLIPTPETISLKKYTLSSSYGVVLLLADKLLLFQRRNRILKRIFDVVFSLGIILLVMSWLYPLVTLCIKLTSKGPVLFKQKRNGIDNREFYCYKFRSMKVNRESDFKQAVDGDCRITSVGKFLRKTSLDEFPQFFNVLKGDMSVVGPRPHMLKHNEFYAKEIEEYNYRTLVKPGITGLSQVLGHRGETESDIYLMKIRVRIDRFYIQNWSFLLDLKIIFKTVIQIIFPSKQAF